jgi:hypothetical protein
MLVHASAEVMVEVEHVVEAGMIGAKVNSEQSLAVPADDGFLSDISVLPRGLSQSREASFAFTLSRSIALRSP